MSRVLEPLGCRTVPGKPIFHFPLPASSITAKHSSTKTTLPPSVVQGVCPVNSSIHLSACLSVRVLHACVRKQELETCKATYATNEPHLPGLILCKVAHCAGGSIPVSSAVLQAHSVHDSIFENCSLFFYMTLINPFTNVNGRNYTIACTC